MSDTINTPAATATDIDCDGVSYRLAAAETYLRRSGKLTESDDVHALLSEVERVDESKIKHLSSFQRNLVGYPADYETRMAALHLQHIAEELQNSGQWENAADVTAVLRRLGVELWVEEKHGNTDGGTAPSDPEPQGKRAGGRGVVKDVYGVFESQEVKKHLEQCGRLTYFSYAPQKRAAYVDFATQEGFQAAVAANPHTIGIYGDQYTVEASHIRPSSTPYVPGSYYTAPEVRRERRGVWE